MKPLSKERALKVESTRRNAQEREKQRQKELHQKHQPLDAVRHVPDRWRLAILRERDSKRAKALFAELAGIKLQDRAIQELFEQLVEQAIVAGDEQIEFPTDLAEAIAVLLKAVPKRGQPPLPKEKRIRERAIYDMARQERNRLIKEERLSREEATSKVIRKIERDPTDRAGVDLPLVELKKVLGKDYTTKYIKDRIQRRKSRTGK